MSIELTIEKMVPPGNGLGYFRDKAVFVPGTTTGDRVEVSIAREKKRYMLADLKQVLSPGPDRIDPACPHYDACGGCSLMHLSYPYQLNLKKQLLNETFAGIPIKEAPPFIASPREQRFRYRATVTLEDDIIGFSDKRSHHITKIEHCRILSQGLLDRLPELMRLGRSHCQFALLESSATGEISISVSDGKSRTPLPGYASMVKEDYGSGLITLRSDGFAQSNPYITRIICEDLLAHASGYDKICELYCGSGTFSIPLSKRGHHLEGFDISKRAIREATENAQANGIHHARFSAVNLEKGLRFPRCDLIVADPPRKGLSSTILRQLGKSACRKVLYLSCDPASLARDCRCLISGHGFQFEQLTGYDMYPHSTHTEALAVLIR